MENFHLTINAEEREYLVRVLESARKGDRVEEGRTDTRAYREQIQQEIRLIEGLLSKLSKPA
jgi:hypothetical protein